MRMQLRPSGALAGITAAMLCATFSPNHLSAATLTGSFASIPRNSVVDLSAAGSIDWVHWGLYSEASLNRKANVIPRISNFTTVSGNHSNAYVFAYQFADNYNG